MVYSDDEVVVGVPGEGSSESCAFVSSRTRSAAASSSMNPIASDLGWEQHCFLEPYC
jgi:hypothetical protein